MSLKDFQIEKNLGKGAFGSVWVVTRKEDGSKYAMKRVKIAQMNQKDKENALNEIRILASLNHPNIIAYHEAFFDDESQTLNIVMDLADDGDIESKIKENQKKRRAFEESTIWMFFIQILNGLKYLHDNKIMHRDLKCANIFLMKNGVLKLGDLNVSKIAKMGLASTQTGTPYYASPEIWKDSPYNYKSDIWSVGCIIYELCTLLPPFRGTSMKNLYENISRGVYSPIPKMYSQELAGVIAKMLVVKADLRPSTSELLNMGVIQKRIHEQKNSAVVDIIENNEEGRASLIKTIKLPRNLKDINGQLPKKRYKKKRQEEMMAYDEYETKKAEIFKQAKEEYEKEKKEKSPLNYHQQIPERENKNYIYPNGKYENRPYSQVQERPIYGDYGGYQRNQQINKPKVENKYDYLNRLFDQNMNKINENKPKQIEYERRDENKYNYHQNERNYERNYERNIDRDRDNIYNPSNPYYNPPPSNPYYNPPPSNPYCNPYRRDPPKPQRRMEIDDYRDIEGRLNKMKQKLQKEKERDNDLNKLIDYNNKDNHKNDLYGDIFKPKHELNRLNELDNYNYERKRINYPEENNFHYRPINRISSENIQNRNENKINYKYHGQLKEDPPSIRDRSPNRMIPQSSNSNSRPDNKNKDRYRNLFDDNPNRNSPDRKIIPKPNKSPIDYRLYKPSIKRSSSNSRASSKPKKDINQIYNPIYKNKDRPDSLRVRESPSKNRLYGAGLGIAGINQNINQNINYVRPGGKINNTPINYDLFGGFKRAPVRNIEIKRLDYNQYLQGLRAKDKFIRGNRDDLYRVMGYPNGYNGPRIVNNK